MRLKRVTCVYDLNKCKLKFTKKEYSYEAARQGDNIIYIRNDIDGKYSELEKRTISNDKDCIEISEYYINDRSNYIAYDMIDYLQKNGYKVRLFDKIKAMFL